MKKKEDGFSGHVKEKGRGLGISAIFIKKIQKPARSWFLAWLIIILVEEFNNKTGGTDNARYSWEYRDNNVISYRT